MGTAFTTSIEAREGVTTGISAADRAKTILTAVDPASKPSDLARPGHVFPLQGETRRRAGARRPDRGERRYRRIAGLEPAAVICEIMNDDGTMARMPELEVFAEKHDLKIISVADLVRYRIERRCSLAGSWKRTFRPNYGVFRTILYENVD